MNSRTRVSHTIVSAVIFGAVLMAAPLDAQGVAAEDGAEYICRVQRKTKQASSNW